ncbi:redoxin domain-containing protein [Pseudodesulfovibrio sp. F-1]|uniref:Redoxin domain-containing protein n=1 Tax=Pseudodesulfovibrio alkaliphilus TaxID=2661613 RepID=A0A7K1KNA9_9BACT|nr:TlpA disulfide reductase family protein [Pseudodesulfovibrio alkaliphilus]MUM77421.1 redoxin domain-containing protein [Pseudodesulfovibrio alkaliphilus]
MSKLGRFAAMIVLGFSLLACSGGAEGEPSAARGIAPLDSAGLDALLADNPGKPSVLFFWTTWCPSCKQQIGEMERFHASRSADVTILSVSLDESEPALRAFFEDKSTTLPVYHGDESLAARFEVEAIPTLVVFDAGGRQIFSRAGVFPLPMLEALADQLAAR